MKRLAAVTAVCLLVISVAGCSAADRAILGTDPCPKSAAATPTVAAPRTPGTVWYWRDGSGAPGLQLEPDEPQQVSGLDDVVAIASTGYTTYAVRSDGTVWAWGWGNLGMLGNDTGLESYASTPQPVPGLSDIDDVFVVGSAVFVRNVAGQFWAWGDAMLVDYSGGGGVVTIPARAPDLDGLVTISGGGTLTAVGLRGDGTVVGWGLNITDTIGDFDGPGFTTIATFGPAVSAGAALSTSFAVTGDGKVCALGDNSHGEFAVTPTGGQSNTARLVPGLTGTRQVATGSATVYALDESGTVRGWGRAVSGSLGDGNTTDRNVTTPIVIAGLPPVTSVAADGSFAYGITKDGELWGWGSSIGLGKYGKDGAGSTPVQIRLPEPVQQVSGSYALLGT